MDEFNDTHGLIHAVILVAAPVATLAICVAGWRRRPTLKRIVGSAFGGAVAAFLLLGFTLHACREGQPFHLWALFSLCGIASVICVSRFRIALAVAAAWVLALIAGAAYYNKLVHGEDYSGTTDRRWEQRRLDALRHNLSSILAQLGKNDSTSYPEEPISRASFIKANPDEFEYLIFEIERSESIPLWHSLWTRLYRRRTVPLELWFLGGTLSEAAERLEYREKVGEAKEH